MAETKTVLTDEVKAMIGVTGDKVEAGLWPVEREDLRRFTQGDQLEARRYMIAVTPRATERDRLTPEQFQAFIQEQIQSYGSLLRAAGVQPD